MSFFVATKARLSYAQELNESEAGQPLQQRLNMSLHRKKKIKKTSSDLTAAKKESVTLTFVTLEEKMRRLRSAAASTEANTKHTRHLQIKGPNDSDSISAGMIEGNIVPGQSDINILPHESSRVILVDTNFLYQTILVNVKEPDLSDPLHKIINRSSSWDVSLHVNCFIFVLTCVSNIFPTLVRFTTDNEHVTLTHGSAYHRENPLRTHGKNPRNLRNYLFVLVQGNGMAKTITGQLVQMKGKRGGQCSLSILLRTKSKVTLERRKQLNWKK